MKNLLRNFLVLALLFGASIGAAQTTTQDLQSDESAGQTQAAANNGDEVPEEDGARDADDPLYPFWNETADSAENKIDSAEDIPTDELEKLRATLANFRTEFSIQRGANAERIANIQSQIAALGTAPEDGIEAPEITVNRLELEEQLEGLLAPVRVADAAFQRAEGLIGEIDRIIRDRKARNLLALGPSPLDPRNWLVAFNDATRILKDLTQDASGVFDRARQQSFREKVPLFLLLTAVSLTLIVKGRGWANAMIDYLRAMGGGGSGVWRFLVSLLRIAIPLFGLYGLAYTLNASELFGDDVAALIGLLPAWGFILLGFRWLAERLYAREDEDTIITIAPDKRSLMRFYMLLMSLLFVSRGIVEVLFTLENAKAETIVVFAFPIVVTMGSVLILLGMRLRDEHIVSPESADEETSAKLSGFERAMRLAGNGTIAVGIAAPIMAAVGYSEAGNALLYPTVLSIVLLGFVVVFQRFGADVYGLLSGQGSAARDGLIAILIGFVLILASLPLLALLWGARIADLTELWIRFLAGFDLGGTRISPSNFLTFAVVFLIGYTITRLIQSTLRQSVLPKTNLDIGGQNALVSGVGYVGIFLAALIAITVAGLDLSGFAIVAGALSVGIGFGLQNIVNNFVSGIILLVERPISEGDWIEVGTQMGYVKDISVRSTRIETFDRTDVIVPNSDLVSGTVTNYTRGNTVGRLIVPVGVAYGTDTKKVEQILREIANAQPLVLGNPPPDVFFMGFGADSLDFEIRAILRDVNWVLSVRNDINHEIARRFIEADIEIPFAQRDIWLRNPETLQSADPDNRHSTDESFAPDDSKEQP
ncbi:MAG: DUF3772 domain-containing protein [Pseudomonadota bacterium]